MKNSIGMAGLSLLVSTLAVLGCVLPTQVSEKQPAPVSTQEPEARSPEKDENEQLREKVAELEKKQLEKKISELEAKIEDGKAPGGSTGVTTPEKKVAKGFGRVNSPNDGFLALRSKPSANQGIRITTIPHGKTLRVYSCGPRTSVNGRSGRWCQVLWRNDVGWVFDAYLIR
ncbi:MAG: cell envelope integrity protein TolA [Pyrinomonadaceae bacterium]|nr:cell envelope integrity protein TolA [Pyrinomonadaceae bacterium]